MIKKSILTLLFRGLGAIIAFVTSLFVTNQFGLENSGVYFFYITAITVISTVFSFGFNDFYVKNISRNYDGARWKEINYILLVSIVSSSFFAFVFIKSSVKLIETFELKQNNFYFSICEFYVTAIYMLLINLFVSFFQSIGRFRFSIFYQSICLPSVFVIDVYLGDHSDAIGAIASYILAMKVTLFFMAVHSAKYLKLTEGISRVKFQGLTSFWTTKFIGVLVGNISILIAGVIGNTSDVSFLSVCIRLVSVISLVLVTMNMMYSPQISKLSSGINKTELKEFVNKITNLLIVFTLPLVLVMFFLSKEVLLLFGAEFIEASLYLKILLVASFVNVLVGPTGSVLNMSGNEKIYKNIVLLSSVAYFITLFILVFMASVGFQVNFTFIVIASAAYTVLINLLGFIAVRKFLGFYTLEFDFVRKK